MILVKIGGIEREFDGNPRWIQEQLEGRNKEGDAVCVRVTINCGEIEFALCTPGCGGGGGMGRDLRSGEQELLELWKKFKLHITGFTSGNLIAFLQQIKRLC